ncbi:type IIL restriction-modification enzyme MmeI [Paracoccus sp. S-4012]|uniref:type IIL restriction-modification enzyme MmeI n=1 Tax=Paracoccus sp. S-4012 TaxID=2665648 RepID=UPI001E3E2598|nr:type IIL restriction-modification enzyme MmeI [Paracoccus sp. S-4012]
MRLNWNEIRARAAAFAEEWAGEGYEKGQTQLFYRDFFDVFGVPIRKVASFEEPVRKLGDKAGFIDLFWKGVLLVEQKSIGRDLVIYSRTLCVFQTSPPECVKGCLKPAASMVWHISRNLWLAISVGHEREGAPRLRGALHDRKEHHEGHRAVVPR